VKYIPTILQSATDSGARLRRIESQPHDSKTEEWLQELLYRHPDLLPVDAFDELYCPPIPVGREVSTARGPIDNLYVSPFGGITVVETKLWKNPERHRTVVAQIIDYAKEIASWDYNDLCEAVIASSRRRNEATNPSLEDKLAPHLAHHSLCLHEFQERVVANLREGNFLLLIVGDRISPNIALLTQAIQSAPGLGFTLGLVELHLYSTKPNDDWPLVVVPDVVGRTVEHTRGIVKIAYTQEKPKVEVAIEEEVVGRTAGSIDLESFLGKIPKDLVEVYRSAVEDWRKVGFFSFGTVGFTWRIRLQDDSVTVLQSYPKDGITLIRQKDFDKWSKDQALYQEYLQTLEGSSVAFNRLQTGNQYLKHDKLTADDLRIILGAALKLAQGLVEAEGKDAGSV
jgi:hypothetical protein